MSIYNVLFLCTGNTARSILAEATMNAQGAGRFKAFSAGSHPKGSVNPFAIELLERHRISTAGLSSKGWEEFAKPGSPIMDIIITVCDQAAGEVCPIWPGRPLSAHWGVEDPAALEGSDDEKRQAFVRAYMVLSRRISLLASLSLDKIDRLVLETKLKDIGRE